MENFGREDSSQKKQLRCPGRIYMRFAQRNIDSVGNKGLRYYEPIFTTKIFNFQFSIFNLNLKEEFL